MQNDSIVPCARLTTHGSIHPACGGAVASRSNNFATYQIEDKTIRIYFCGTNNGNVHSQSAPAVYLNMYQDSSGAIIDELGKMATPPFILAVISGLNWDDDMTPWPCPPISKDDTPCGGLADGYLKLLTERIIPSVEEKTGTPIWRGIAGYSLGGLFALYALYRTNVFCRAASMSGSLWYPDWMEYVGEHGFATRPERVYLSLGDKECAARNKYLKCVQEKTEAYYALLKQQGIRTQFILNHGNHFVDAALRTAMGIAWIAEEE